MIGRVLRRKAPVLTGVLAVLLLGGLLAARSADPLRADPVAAAALRSTIAAERAQAEAQLLQLERTLSAALDDGRDGAALTVQGTQRPGPHLSDAAEAIGRADPQVGAVNDTIRRLAANLAVVDHAGSAPSLGLEPGQLASIGGQLLGSADAADAFWSMRRATETTLAGLADAFAAIDAKDPAAALRAVAAAEQSLDRVRAWPGNLLTLPVWTQATSDLLAALRALAIAIRDDDPVAARAAQARYQEAAASAHRADIALAVAIAEGGSAVSDDPLAAAAIALRSVDDALAEVRSILV
jgi:hypothetical protein